MADNPVEFLQSLHSHLEHDDRNAQHYWRYPGHVDVWPGEQPGILSVSSEIGRSPFILRNRSTQVSGSADSSCGDLYLQVKIEGGEGFSG